MKFVLELLYPTRCFHSHNCCYHSERIRVLVFCFLFGNSLNLGWFQNWRSMSFGNYGETWAVTQNAMTESFCKGPLPLAALNHQTWKTLVLLPFFSFPENWRLCHSSSSGRKHSTSRTRPLPRWKLAATSAEPSPTGPEHRIVWGRANSALMGRDQHYMKIVLQTDLNTSCWWFYPVSRLSQCWKDHAPGPDIPVRIILVPKCAHTKLFIFTLLAP